MRSCTSPIPASRRALAATMAGLIALQPFTGSLAANHPNSSIQNVNVVNMTANVDWDYDATAPTQANGTIVLTKTVVEKEILREMARKMFLMTEGRHRVGTVYVYKNGRFKNSVDLQLFNVDGRSNANTNAWQAQTGTSNNYLSISNQPYSLTDYSNVLAHEMGHYLYGLLDEYREEPSGGAARTSAPATNLGGPAGFDTTKITIMHLSNVATRFSVAEDYAGDPAANNTAQARVFATDRTTLRGGSAWEVLTRDPANDPPQAKDSNGVSPRIYFDAFKNMTPPATLASLKYYLGGLCTILFTPCTDTPDASVAGPTGGTVTLFDQRVPAADRVTDASVWQSRLWQKSGGSASQDAADGAVGAAFENFKVVWADSPTQGATAAAARNAIIVNRSVPASVFQQVIDTAVGIVNRAPSGSQLSIIATPLLTENAGAEIVLGLTPTDSGKDALISALRSIKRNDDAPALQAAYNQFVTLLPANRQPVDTSEVFFITQRNGSFYPPSVDFPAKVRADRVPFTITELQVPAAARVAKSALQLPVGVARALGLTTAAGSAFSDLAKATGGHLNVAKSSEEAIKEAQRASDFSAGKSPALVAATDFDAGAKGGKSSFSIQSTVYDKSVTAKWYFDPVDAAKVSFKLTPPQGSVSTAVAAESNVAQGYAVITLPTGGAAGTWTAEVTYSDATTDGVSAEMLTDSSVQMTASASGGSTANAGKPPVLMARLVGDFPVAGALVTADVTNIDTGELVLSKVVLKDDGQGVDSRPNDGSYAVDLSGKLPPGDYEVVVTAVSVNGTVFQPNQVFIPGGIQPTIPVASGLSRLEFAEFSLDAGAQGVLAASSGGSATTPSTNTPTVTLNSSSGGCTVSNGQQDAGLLLLLLVALVGLGLRRNTRRVSKFD